MTWWIGPIQLPIPPEEVEKSAVRKLEGESAIKQFGIPLDLGPDVFQFQLKGLIWPTVKAGQLVDMIKREDRDSIVVRTDDPNFEAFTGQYLVQKTSVKLSGPEFIKDTGFTGGEGPVHHYDITFVQFANQSSIANGDSLDLEGDETGIGFMIEEIFGKFQWTDFANTITQFFTV